MYEQALHANILIDCTVLSADPGPVEEKSRTGNPIEGRSFLSNQLRSAAAQM